MIFGTVVVAMAPSAAADPQVIYLNYNGVTVSPGANDARADRSSLVVVFGRPCGSVIVAVTL